MRRRKNIFKICLVFLILCEFFIAAHFVFGADGSGTNTVSPSAIVAGSSGNTLQFTFSAAETMDSGGMAITIPSGFTPPQGISGTAGYTAISSASGIVANVEDAADSLSGWSAGSACSNGISIDTSAKHEGAAAIACANGNQGGGNKWYKTISAEDWTGYTTVSFWIRVSADVLATNLRFAYDNGSTLGSPLEQISLPALSANTWTYIVLNFGSTNRTSVASYGFVIRDKNDLDNKTVWIDDILIGPGSLSFPGAGIIKARFLQLSSGQTATVAYGSGGGSSGVTAPGTAGNYTFITQSRPSDSGILSNIISSPQVTVASAPVTPTKFIIINPSDTVAGGSATVTVRAEDAGGNLATSYNSDVTLAASGSATGGGLVDIINGIGTKTITDNTAETVNLTLSDTQGTGLDVSSTQDVIFSATNSNAAAPSLGQQLQTSVEFFGRAYPGAVITVLAKSETVETPIEQSVVGSPDGSFDIKFEGIFSGYYSYGLKATDKDGRSTLAKFYNLDLSLYSVTQSNIFIAPTIAVGNGMVGTGQKLIISGYATPKQTVKAEIDGNAVPEFAIADSSGFYSLSVDVSKLKVGSHTVRAKERDETFGLDSDWSLLAPFSVSGVAKAKTDFNNDGIVNISDWSIFLSYWKKTGEERKSIDLNGDGKVDIADFSLFIATFKNLSL